MADSHRRRVFTSSASIAAAGTDTHTHVMSEKRVALSLTVKGSAAGLTFTAKDQSGQTIIGPDAITPEVWSPDGMPYRPELPGGPLVLDVNQSIVLEIENPTAGAIVATSMVETVLYSEWIKSREGRIKFARDLAAALKD